MTTDLATLVNEIRRTLVASHLRLAVAESLTAGHVQQLLTTESGASDFFEGGMTAYSIPQKVNLLGVDAQTAAACNAVSAEVAQQMAAGVCELFQCQIGVATTGYAEPSEEHNVVTPFAFVAVCQQNAPAECKVQRFDFSGSRNQVQQACALASVRLIHQFIHQ